jgi:hypothetical protein
MRRLFVALRVDALAHERWRGGRIRVPGRLRTMLAA